MGVSKIAGNSALVGASMLLLRREFIEECEALVKHAAVLDLSTDKAFSDLYVSGMELSEIEQ